MDWSYPAIGHFRPGDTFVLSMPRQTKRWERKAVVGPPTQQYFHDWRREWAFHKEVMLFWFNTPDDSILQTVGGHIICQRAMIVRGL